MGLIGPIDWTIFLITIINIKLRIKTTPSYIRVNLIQTKWEELRVWVLFRKRCKKVNNKFKKYIFLNSFFYFKYILNIGGLGWVRQIYESYNQNPTQRVILDQIGFGRLVVHSY